jgi:TatD DNase family protein
LTVELIDTHAHLDDERFQSDLHEVLTRAANAGVAQVITIATTRATSSRSIEIAKQFPAVSATVGIQPNHVAEAEPADWDEILKLVNAPKVVAFGETGLDRYWDRTPFAQQEDYFARHLDLARTTGLPVVIHCRQAEADVIRMLRDDFNKHGPVRGVMHSYTGDIDTARECLAMGLHISFAGMLSYKNAGELRNVAREIPIDRLLVETDSPYLTPVPHRGKRNEPAYVVHTLTVLATVQQIGVEDLAVRTTANARRLFSLK